MKLLAGLLLGVVAACSGGGDGSGQDVVDPPFDIAGQWDGQFTAYGGAPQGVIQLAITAKPPSVHGECVISADTKGDDFLIVGSVNGTHLSLHGAQFYLDFHLSGTFSKDGSTLLGTFKSSPNFFGYYGDGGTFALIRQLNPSR